MRSVRRRWWILGVVVAGALGAVAYLATRPAEPVMMRRYVLGTWTIGVRALFLDAETGAPIKNVVARLRDAGSEDDGGHYTGADGVYEVRVRRRYCTSVVDGVMAPIPAFFGVWRLAAMKEGYEPVIVDSTRGTWIADPATADFGTIRMRRIRE